MAAFAYGKCVDYCILIRLSQIGVYSARCTGVRRHLEVRPGKLIVAKQLCQDVIGGDLCPESQIKFKR